MSATLYYSVPKKSKPHIPCCAPSRFTELAENVTGNTAPWRFDSNHLDRLRGMLDVGTGIDDSIQRLVQLIEQHGQVDVWKEY